MKSSLKSELNSFWKWAGIVPSEFAQSEIPEKIARAEWEGDYPYWNRLQKAVEREIKIYNETLNEESALLILEILAIDHDSEVVLDKLAMDLNDSAQLYLAKLGSIFYMNQARWQIAEFLKISSVPDKEKFLIKMITYDKDKYVQRRALLSLAHTDPGLAVEYAFQKLRDDDEYLRLISLRLLKEHSSEKLREAITILENDPSILIKDEINKASQ